LPDFESDLLQEQILSKYLDSIYAAKNLQFERVFDLERQMQGIDVIIKHDFNNYFIDEKSQLHYINSDLPTFTFELSYLKDGKLKQGWLFDNSKLTQYYFLVTGIHLKENKKELLNFDDIDGLKITSANRVKLLNHLNSIGLSEETLSEYDTGLRRNKSFGKNTIPELDNKTNGLIYFTKHLSEKPINLQLRLKYLIDCKVAKKFFYVRHN
jgi:hypothetical protein